MNLSPDWVAYFENGGIEAIHWSSVGLPTAKDSEIIDHALRNNLIVLTHDLDFGAILALTNSEGPSVIQIRSQNIIPSRLADTVIQTIQRNNEHLIRGALIVIDEFKERVRVLPLSR